MAQITEYLKIETDRPKYSFNSLGEAIAAAQEMNDETC